jgi:hypothetical protein
MKMFSSCSPLLLTSLLPLSLARSHNQTSFVAGTAFSSPLCFGFSKISHSCQNNRSTREGTDGKGPGGGGGGGRVRKDGAGGGAWTGKDRAGGARRVHYAPGSH